MLNIWLAGLDDVGDRAGAVHVSRVLNVRSDVWLSDARAAPVLPRELLGAPLIGLHGHTGSANMISSRSAAIELLKRIQAI